MRRLDSFIAKMLYSSNKYLLFLTLILCNKHHVYLIDKGVEWVSMDRMTYDMN